MVVYFISIIVLRAGAFSFGPQLARENGAHRYMWLPIVNSLIYAYVAFV